MDIVKLTVWLVPGQRERPARWDAEIVRAHGLRERMTAVPEDVVDRLLRDMAEITKRTKVTRTTSR